MKRILSLCLLAALLLTACTAVADAPPSSEPSGEPAGVQTLTGDALPSVGSMEDLRALLEARSVFSSYSSALREDVVFNGEKSTAADDGDAAAAEVPAAVQGTGETTSGGDYSQTNSQVSGVDEGDIIKTDGTYLYVSDYRSIAIVKADGADMESLSRIELPENAWVSEMYVRGDRLVAVYQYYQYETFDTKDGTDDAESAQAATCVIWRPGRSYTAYAVYDIADRSNPVLARSVEIEGSNLTTRMVGDIVYFVNQRSLYNIADGAEDEDILPAYRDTAAGDAVTYIAPEKIAYCPQSTDASYLLAGAFDVSDAVPCEPVTILGAGGTVYMSQANLYIAHTEYQWGPIRILTETVNEDAAVGADEGRTKTTLYRLAVDGTDLTLAATGEIDGWLLGQYSMDEYDGHLRAAVTSYDENGEEVNGVYVLNDDLSLAGAVTGLAEGETIQSVRFSGATGYVVTYEQTDPLFVLDLSDPAAPAVTGELKIPGFSQYLHDFGDGLLVGVGRNTVEYYTRDENGVETVEGVMDKGMKVSVFDVSDPQNPREITSLKLGTNGSIWSEAAYNPRCIMVDDARGVMAFPVSDYSGALGGGSGKGVGFNGCVVLDVSRDDVSLRAALGDGMDEYYGGSQRMAYIGDTLYRFTGASLVAYDYDTCNELSSLDGLFS